jgi:hypothetical protein
MGLAVLKVAPSATENPDLIVIVSPDFTLPSGISKKRLIGIKEFTVPPSILA